MAQMAARAPETTDIDVAGALKGAAFTAVIALGLFLPLIGLKTKQDIHNELVLEPRFPLLLTFVVLAVAGSLLMSLVITPWRARRLRRVEQPARVPLALARWFAPFALGFVSSIRHWYC